MKLIYRFNINNGLFLLFIFLLLIGQSSCKAYKDNTRIIIAGAGKITSADPAQASTFHAIQLISAIGDPLYRINSEGKLIPILASNLPKISKNGLELFIPLKENIYFHDGTKFNAEAMVFSLNRFIKIGTTNYILDNRISSIEALEPYLIKIKLTRRSSSINGLLTSINLTPVSPNAYKDHKDKFLNQKFIGTGAYKLTNFNSHQQRLEPFENYWGEKAKNKGINFISLSNSTALFAALRSKEIDLLLSNSLDEDQRKYLDQMAKKGELRTGEGNALEIGFISINTSTKPFDNASFREAIARSIDRELISERVSYNSRSPIRTIVPSTLAGEKLSPWPKYSPHIAKKLLRELGYCRNKQAKVDLTFRSNVPADKLLALTWQEQIKRDLPKCLSITLNGLESTTIYRQLSKGSFQLVILDWRGAYPDPEAYLTPLLSCKKINNATCEEGEAVNSGSFWGSSLINKTIKESEFLNGSKRLLKLKEVEEYAAKNIPYIPIWAITPKAWSQPNINKPEFDESGYLLLKRLRKVK